MKKIILLSILSIYTFSFSQKNTKQAKSEIQAYLDAKEARIEEFLAKSVDFDRSKKGQIWDIFNGKPIFIMPENTLAAVATRANHLKPEGSLNLELTGENMVIGIWEAEGVPQADHIELIGEDGLSRVQIVDDIGTDFHSTHVAGTLVARGANPSAEGMATKASLVAYDNIDDVQEVLSEATDNNLLISNHSYGVAVSTAVDADLEWFMGSYHTSARLWDLVTYNAPYYLPVKSAGNSGNVEYEGGIAPGFDKLTGNKLAKNVLVVANARQVGVIPGTGQFFFANINSSSSQGPTDDGRIKPDITGLGTNILSSSPGNGYGQATGTSMSAPNVSGSALLLQELYFNNNDAYMLSQTLKGLICVTADDAGEEGPDQFSGWGLMNSKRAAEAILNSGINDIIIEDELSTGDSQTFRITYDSDEDLKVAIAWTDAPGEAVEFGTFNDVTPRLVNDLDLRVTDVNTGVQSFPWKLDLSNLTSPAIVGDNSVDNIEIIELNQPGTYDIEISHKGSLLTGSQSYSLIALNAEEVPLSNVEFNSSSLQLWPNPTTNNLNINVENFNDNINVNIADMLGRIVYSNNFNLSSALSIDVSNLSKGLYIIELNDGDVSVKSKFLKK